MYSSRWWTNYYQPSYSSYNSYNSYFPSLRNLYRTSRNYNDNYSRFHPTPRPAPAEEEAITTAEKELLKVTAVDILVSQNSEMHHTDDYELPLVEYDDDGGDDSDDEGDDREVDRELVVRRGQEILFKVEFHRDYDPDHDKISLRLEVDTIWPTKSGHVKDIPLNGKGPTQFSIVEGSGKKFQLQLQLSSSFPIGKWKASLILARKDGDAEGENFSKTLGDLFVLFNPWHKDDDCYMADEKQLEEYVLNDTGYVYKASRRKPWTFGQFDKAILPGVLDLIDKKSLLPVNERGNAVKISRRLAALVNSSDDDGVLTGNWSGEYSGGKRPSKWQDSRAILKQYFKTQEPVKYGQCWVFAAVLNTVCRAVGIPCLCVTNLDSAHDNDGDCVIDRYYDKDNNKVFSGGSVWNFHVWNQVFLSRPDINITDGEWQALDATPQETSACVAPGQENKQVYTCGPFPISLIKKGDVGVQYDGAFIFAEVNSDVIHWREQEDGTYRKTSWRKRAVGTKLLAKTHESDRPELTDMYKHKEGTQEERESVWKAVKSCNSDFFERTYGIKEPEVEATVDGVHPRMMGKDIEIKVKLNNRGPIDYKFKARLQVKTITYTGEERNTLFDRNFDVSLRSKKDDFLVAYLEACKTLCSKMEEGCHLSITCSGSVPRTLMAFDMEEHITLEKPDLEVKAPEHLKHRERYNLEITFKNPTDEKLTGCEFNISAAKMQREITRRFRDIKPFEEVKAVFRLKARAARRQRPMKKRTIIVDFDSNEVEDLFGAVCVTVSRN